MRAVNLIPSEHRGGASAGAGRSGGSAYAVLAVVGGLAILALLYGMADHQISSRTSEAAALTARAQAAEAQAAQLAPYTSFMALRETRMQAVSELVDARFDWAHAFQELGRVLPRDASIGTLAGTVGSASSASTTTSGAPAAGTAAAAAAAPTVTSATPPGSVPSFSVTGCATSQSEVALTLERLRLMDGVNEVTLQSSSKSGSGGSSSGSAGCEGSDPGYTIQITFAPLPSSSAITSATKLTSATGATR
jgi:Tfp pilus assembly protein PilN